MDPVHFGALAVLALVDSTSFGTLLLPVWLLMAPGRLRPARILLFLGTVAAFYFGVGLAILFGAGIVLENYAGLFDSRGFQVILLAAGAALLAWSFQLEDKAKKEKAARVAALSARAPDGSAAPDGAPALPPGRLAGWRNKAVGGDAGRSGAAALIGLALAAATLELATMLPYLGAIGLISASGLQWPVTGAVLAGYCLLMVAPALVLLFARLTAARRVDPLLKKLDAFLTRTSANTLSWVTGILGVVLIVNTAGPVLSFGG